MGKKRAVVIGSENESQTKASKAVKLQQKKLREGKFVSAPQPTEAAPSPVSEPTPTSSTSIPSPTKKAHRRRSKLYKASKAAINSDTVHSLPDGISLLRKVSHTKFDPTVELHLVFKTPPSQNSFTVLLPHSFGASKKVVVATDTVVSQIEAGKIDFDVLVASPAQMAKLVKFAKVLGPRGLMPNPKNGTVADNPETTAKKLSSDPSRTFKLDKSGPVIHATIGKLSFKDIQLEENIAAISSVLPTSNLRKIILKSTMSPAIKLSL